ncbi:(4Fe-4S)-binding protein [Algoriphagus confluentis]
MGEIKKEYSNGEVTITWEPKKCIHSAKCVNGLPSVFNAEKKPWIDPMGAGTDHIVAQIQTCPSGALGYYFENKKEEHEEDKKSEQIVEVVSNGPLMVYGNLQVKLPDGEVKKQFKVTAFCRCGSSSNKPYCDGTHKKISFQG